MVINLLDSSKTERHISISSGTNSFRGVANFNSAWRAESPYMHLNKATELSE